MPRKRRPDPPAELRLPEDAAPVRYATSFAAEARMLCARGAGEAELAAHFGVTVWDIKLWKVTHQDFLSACKLGREAASDRAELSLFERVIGYTYDAIKPMVVGGELQMVPVKEHVPPDVGAAKFWLLNMRPDIWKERVEQTVRVADTVDMSDDELVRIAAGGGPNNPKPARGPRGPDSLH